jgi:hypothetical protein
LGKRWLSGARFDGSPFPIRSLAIQTPPAKTPAKAKTDKIDFRVRLASASLLGIQGFTEIPLALSRPDSEWRFLDINQFKRLL